jgi:hypothetical protein
VIQTGTRTPAWLSAGMSCRRRNASSNNKSNAPDLPAPGAPRTTKTSLPNLVYNSSYKAVITP